MEKTGNSAHDNLMSILEKAAGGNASTVIESEAPIDTGQNAPETKGAEQVEEVVQPKVEKPAKAAKDEKPAKAPKEKFWAKKDADTPAPTTEQVDWVSKYKELESNLNKTKQEYESKLNSESYKRFQEISESGNIDELIAEIAHTNPKKKSTDELLRDRTIRSLAKMYGEDKVTEDLIEEQLELVKNKDVVTLDDMAEAERKFQLETFNSKLEKFKSPKSKDAELLAQEIEKYHESINGKEVHGLPVTADRQKRMDTLIESYSKGERKLSGQELYDALYFLEHKAEIFDNILEEYGTSKIEDAIASVKGSEIRVGNTRTTDMGSVKSAEETNYEALRKSVGTTTAEMEKRLAQLQSK